MTAENIFPTYIARTEEERQIRQEAQRVRAEKASRAVLLYGAGGVGKTQLVRALADASKSDPDMAWLDPIDVDDAEYWLLSNLERRVVEQLDPDQLYFEPYLSYLHRLPGYTLDRIDHETVVSHLGKIKQEFANCYAKFAEQTGKTIVIVFDTVEVVRGVSLLYTLTEWMKSLPATLFVLSGRPMPAGAGVDPIVRELQEGPLRLPVTAITLGEFSKEAAFDFLGKSFAATSLTDEEKAKLVLLTRGHPLWLAFTISYLMGVGIPQEAEAELADLERNLPYDGNMTAEGRRLHELYKRRLVHPYEASDFEHEAIKRLAVVRQSVSQEIWQQLMEDRAAKDGVASLEQEWVKLLQMPWIRARGNGRYVTLHDAVAEELSLRILPVQDQDQRWRRGLWRRAATIYSDLSTGPAEVLKREQDLLFARLRGADEGLKAALEGRSPGDGADVKKASAFIEEIARLDGRKRELDEFRAISLHYELLSNFESGAGRFLELFEQAIQQHDPLPQERFALEMQRFWPSSVHPYALEDVVGQVVNAFRRWLTTEGRDYYEQIAVRLAQYQNDAEQPQAANEILADLPEKTTDPVRRYQLNLLRGNAYMRIPGRSLEGAPYFDQALAEANAMESAEALLLRARAYKELGFYNRHLGRWEAADESYQRARDVMTIKFLEGGNVDADDRQEMASIQRNWAYVKGISGHYSDGMHLIDSAISRYRRLGLRHDEAAALSIKSEILRYEQRFAESWKSSLAAEQIFESLRNRTWLGTVIQRKAICLAQARREGTRIVGDGDRDQQEEAKRLINQALGICREQNLRAYPSALSRAARIFGADDIDVGLSYAEQGIDWGYRLSDGWRWTACLVEYVELCYLGLVATGEQRYRDGISRYEGDVERATTENDFLDLRGKWNLLQGHLKIRDSAGGQDLSRLAGALENYKTGFSLIARSYAGSSSAFTIGSEFQRFGELLSELPKEVRTEWLIEFRRTWSELGPASTTLLAYLEELY